jgi:2-oxoglutarate dehydrogenase E1 component
LDSEIRDIDKFSSGAFGPNAWLIDEMYQSYLTDPNSVSENWQEFFKDYKFIPGTPSSARTKVTSETQAQTSVVPIEIDKDVVALKGPLSLIATNMEQSLTVPTATSVRAMFAKLLIENRALLNEYTSYFYGIKISYSHIISYAIVKSLKRYPSMTNVFVSKFDGKQNGVKRVSDFGIGIAVDSKRKDGSRILYVPCIKNAGALEFNEFVGAYEELIRKAKSNKLTADDFSGVTVSITNLATIGTEHSIPRLMVNQSAIIGVGSIKYDPTYQGSDTQLLAELKISPQVTLTSTYDHRVIQGAESGEFLNYVDALLKGEYEFYDELFNSFGVLHKPYTMPRSQESFQTQEFDDDRRTNLQANMISLVNSYRKYGHFIAKLDPLHLDNGKFSKELTLEAHGLTIFDLDRLIKVPHYQNMQLKKVLAQIRKTYTYNMGIEFDYLSDNEEFDWFIEQLEHSAEEISEEDKLHILNRLNAAESFETFLHSRYIGQKRFGLEGAESTIVLIDKILNSELFKYNSTAVIGMAHRGRLNILVNIVGKSYEDLFKQFEGLIDADSVQGSGDVKYHKGAHGHFKTLEGNSIDVELMSNPSHLESASPVALGFVRGLQDSTVDTTAGSVGILLHGDAALSGQGVVYETFNLSKLKGYTTKGTIHIVINNQIGFTTSPHDGRSSYYCTDIAKVYNIPVIHVNADNPDSCYIAAKVAADYRLKFNKDIIVDLVCYRLHGHNEGDDPSYTHPIMYEKIDNIRTVRKQYTELLLRRDEITVEQAETSLKEFQDKLQAALDATRKLENITPEAIPLPKPPTEPDVKDTSITLDELTEINNRLLEVPNGFNIHPKLLRQIDAKKKMLKEGELDWAMGELSAYASLLKNNISIRLSGQDSRRGTFSHRHAVWVDTSNNDEYYPLSLFSNDTSRPMIYDSPLSEYAVLGFDYGYSLSTKDTLVLWEAQFGDFANGAQIIIDNFLAAAEDKWDQYSNLVLLLPHGYEGQGPEHSSARLERFLALSAGGNILVAQPTTAAQFFHLIRYQALYSKKPLVVASPKSLLRAKQARSKADKFVTGGFLPLIQDPILTMDDSKGSYDMTKRLIICSGKIGIELLDERDTLLKNNELDKFTAVVRLERLYPFPRRDLSLLFEKLINLEEITFVQDEPDNMGTMPYSIPRIEELTSDKIPIKQVARIGSGSPATGSAAIHSLEQKEIFKKAFS